MSGGPWVTFWLGEAEYAFDVADAVEMVPAFGFAAVPGTAEEVAGIATWRGKSVPVLDLRTILKLEQETPDDRKRLLVLGHPSPFGVLVDRPGRMLRSSEVERVERTGEVPSDEGPGLLRSDRGLVRILNPRRLLGDAPDLLAGKLATSETGR